MSSKLVAAILSGQRPASDAIGRPDLYDALNAGTNGPLPFLGGSHKIDLNSEVGVLGTVLYMLAADQSGREACAGRSKGCTEACLIRRTGHMDYPNAIRARIRRHASFFADRSRFLTDLAREIEAHERKARKLGKIASVRLNGTTDLPWHRMKVTWRGRTYANLHSAFPNVRFYEYTKLPFAIQSRNLPPNLHLTFSVSEREDAESRAVEYLSAGYGAAVVTFTKRHKIPASFPLAGKVWPTTDGDAHDARFVDPSGHIVILSAKGLAKKDQSGFVRAA